MSQKPLVIMAAFNEAGALVELLPKIPRDVVDLLVVDDGSADATAKVADGYGRVLRLSENGGKSWAVRKGFALGFKEGYETFLTVDGDGQHDLAMIPSVIGALEDADVVLCSRYHPESPGHVEKPPLDRQLLNLACREMVRAAAGGLNFTDPLCGFRGFRRWVVKEILRWRYVTDGYGFELETLLRLVYEERQYRIHELPHPAIYNGSGKIAALYDDGYLEARLRRISDHQRHIVQVLRSFGIQHIDVAKDGHKENGE